MGLILVKEKTMRQLTQQEHHIYSGHIMTELRRAFEQYGTIKLDDLKQLISINYEISEITDNIYPILEFSHDYKDINNINKFNMNTYPNNLLDEYQIETIEVPSVHLNTGHFTGRITPYMTNGEYIYENYLKPYGLTQCFNVEYIPKTILTNGDQKDFNFIKQSIGDIRRDPNDTTIYTLPIDYSSEQEELITEIQNDITNKIQQSLDKIKPIDIYQLREIIDSHYQ